MNVGVPNGCSAISRATRIAGGVPLDADEGDPVGAGNSTQAHSTSLVSRRRVPKYPRPTRAVNAAGTQTKYACSSAVLQWVSMPTYQYRCDYLRPLRPAATDGRGAAASASCPACGDAGPSGVRTAGRGVRRSGVRSALDASARSAESPAGRHPRARSGAAGHADHDGSPARQAAAPLIEGGSPCPTSSSPSTKPAPCAIRRCPATTGGIPTSRPPSPSSPASRSGWSAANGPTARSATTTPPTTSATSTCPVRTCCRARSTSRAPNPATCSSSTSSISGRCPRRSATRPARAGATPASSPRPTAAASSPTTSPTRTRRSGTSRGQKCTSGTSPASSSPASPTPDCSAPHRRPSCWRAGTLASGP